MHFQSHKSEIKRYREQIKEVKDSLLELQKISVDTKGLSNTQIKLLDPKKLGNLDQFQSYIDKINNIQNADLSKLNPNKKDFYQTLQLQQYAKALSDLAPKQAALLLSTQDISNAQIKQILTTRGLTTEQQYQAMTEAGLLKNKQSLNNAELQNAIASITNSDAKAKETMASMGLTVATEGEESQTVQLTAKKLALAVQTGVLTQAEAQQIAMTTGVTIAQKTQLASTMPQWIAQMKAMAVATWNQVKATIAWLASNPAGWAIAAIAAIASVTALIVNHQKKQAEAFEKATKTAQKYKDAISDIQTESKETTKTAESLMASYAELAKGVNLSNDKNVSLTCEEYEEFLNVNNQLAELFPSLTKNYDENGNAILGLGGSVQSVTGNIADLIEQQEKLAKLDAIKSLESYVDGDDEGGGQLDVIEGLEEKALEAETALKDFEDRYRQQYKDILYDRKWIVSPNNLIKEEELIDILGLTSDDLDTIRSIELGDDGISRSVYDFSLLDDRRKNAILQSYNSFYNALYDDYIYAQSKLEAANQEMSSMMMMWVENEASYADGGKAFQTVIQNMIHNVDWHNLNLNSFGNAKEWIEQNIFNLINSVEGDDKIKVTNALNQLLTLDFSEMSIDDARKQVHEYLNTLAEILGQDVAYDLKISFGFDEYDNLSDSYRTLLHNAALNASGTTESEVLTEHGNYQQYHEIYDKIDEFAAEQSINTREEIAAFADALEKANGDIDKAFAYYLTQQESISSNVPLTVSETVTAINTKLKPSLESLRSLYQSIFTDDGLDLTNVDISGLSSMMEDLAELGVSTEDYETFVKVLSDSSSPAENVQQAFNGLATSILQTANVAGVTEENYGLLVQQLKNLGITNAEEVLSELYSAQKELTALGFDFANAEYESAKALLETGKCSEIAKQYLISYMATKQIAEQPLDTTQDVEALEELCKGLGASGELLAEVAKLKSLLSIADTDYGRNSVYISDEIEKTRARVLEMTSTDYTLGFDFDFNGNETSASTATSSAATDYTALLDKETSLLEKQLDANLITFRNYLDKRKSLLDDYYTLGKITAEEYYDGLSALYESQLSTYDKVVGTVTNRIDKEIDSLEKQKEVIEESYQYKIDAVQAEIDALNKENKARKEQIALEQAQYEAERARNQRSVKQFVNGQFVYMADMDEVKAAEENLAEQEQQREISRLEDRIASLEQEMENATASLDNQISALEAYKEQWSEISSVYEEQQNALIAAEILGADWEAQILSGRLATLQAFTNQYIALQQAQANAAAQAAQTPTPPANNNGNAGEQTTHAYYAMTRTGQTVTATPFSSSTEAWNWLVNTYGSLDAHQNYKVVQKYADGGVIGAQPGLLDFIAQAVNEDHLIAARQGERILTASQNKQFEALVKLAPELLSMHHPLQNLSVPDSFRTLSTPASTPNITIGDIHLHNVNDVNSLSRAIIQRLPGQMMQAIHRH